MRYMGRRVKMNGYEGEVVSYDQRYKTYSVKFDAGHPFRMDKWDGFSDSTIKLALIEEEQSVSFGNNYKTKKCECGVYALNFRDISPYAHATWCDMFKKGEGDE